MAVIDYIRGSAYGSSFDTGAWDTIIVSDDLVRFTINHSETENASNSWEQFELSLLNPPMGSRWQITAGLLSGTEEARFDGVIVTNNDPIDSETASDIFNDNCSGDYLVTWHSGDASGSSNGSIQRTGYLDGGSTIYVTYRSDSSNNETGVDFVQFSFADDGSGSGSSGSYDYTSIAVPTGNTYYYDGSTHYGISNAPSALVATSSGTASASAIGTYYVTYSLRNGYCWENANYTDTADKRVYWRIISRGYINGTGHNRTWTGSAQDIYDVSDSSGHYYLGFGSSTTSAPTSDASDDDCLEATNVGTYYVWGRTDEDGDYAEMSWTYLATVTISDAVSYTTTNYDYKCEISASKYSSTSSKCPVTGGTSNLTWNGYYCTQTVYHWGSGSTTTDSSWSSWTTGSSSECSVSGSATGFTMANDGTVTIAKNNQNTRQRSCTYTVTYRGKTASVTLYQEADDYTSTYQCEYSCSLTANNYDTSATACNAASHTCTLTPSAQYRYRHYYAWDSGDNTYPNDWSNWSSVSYSITDDGTTGFSRSNNTVTIAKNSYGSARSCKYTLTITRASTYPGSGTSSADVTIYQAADANETTDVESRYIVKLTADNYTSSSSACGAAGGSTSLHKYYKSSTRTVYANWISGAADTYGAWGSYSSSWISFSGYSVGTVSVSDTGFSCTDNASGTTANIAQNAYGSARNGTYTFTYTWENWEGDDQSTSAEITLYQSADSYSTSTEYGNYSLTSASGDTTSFGVSGGTGTGTANPKYQSRTVYTWASDAADTYGDWSSDKNDSSVTKWESSQSWLTLSSTTAASMTYTVASNSGAARSATVTATYHGLTKSFTVSQSAHSYTLSWGSYPSGASFNGGTSAGSVAAGTSLTAPTASLSGYSFSYWSPSVPSTMPAADSTYTAYFAANTIRVNFDANNGSLPGSGSGKSYVDITYGTTVGNYPSITKPTRTRYTFAGYYSAASGGTQYYNSAGNNVTTWNIAGTYNSSTGLYETTLYAHWNGVYQSITTDSSSATYKPVAQYVTLSASGYESASISYSTSFTVKNSSGTALSGWSLTSAGQLTVPASTSAGTYTLTVSITAGQTTNYLSNTQSKTITLTIGKATPTLHVSGSTIAYDDNTSHATSITGYATYTYTKTDGTSETINVPGKIWCGTKDSGSMGSSVSVSSNTTIVTQTGVGTTAIDYYFVPTDTTSYSSVGSSSSKYGSAAAKVTSSTDPSVTVGTYTPTYTGSAVKIAAVTASHGITHYTLGYATKENASTSEITWMSQDSNCTAIDADSAYNTLITYYIWYKLTPDAGHDVGTDTAKSTGKYVGSTNILRATTAAASVANKTYNGNEQDARSTDTHVSWSGTYKATYAGTHADTTYTAYATPVANYAWSDGTIGDSTLKWTMSAVDPTYTVTCDSNAEAGHATAYVKIYANVAGTAYETYNGTALTSSNYSTSYQKSASVTAGNGTSTNACTIDSGSGVNSWTIYTYFVPTNTNYYCKSSGPQTRSLIASTDASASAVTGIYYDGTAHTGVTGHGVTWSGTTSATYTGSYTAYATPDSNHTWSDGTKTKKTITWTIDSKNYWLNSSNTWAKVKAIYKLVNGVWTIQSSLANAGFTTNTAYKVKQLFNFFA